MKRVSGTSRLDRASSSGPDPLRRIHVFQPQIFAGHGATEACYQFCAEWKRLGHDVQVHTVVAYRRDEADVLRAAIPK